MKLRECRSEKMEKLIFFCKREQNDVTESLYTR